jgi:hypothetical protein
MPESRRRASLELSELPADSMQSGEGEPYVSVSS